MVGDALRRRVKVELPRGPVVLGAGGPVGDEMVRRKRSSTAVGAGIGADRGT